MERFEWRTLTGRPRRRTYIELGDDLVVHYALFDDVHLTMEQVHGVVRVTKLEDEPVLRFKARWFQLQGSSLDPNVVFYCDPPAHVSGFRVGSKDALKVTRAERRTAVDVNGFGLLLAEPDAFVEAIERRGIRRYRSVNELLGAEVGLAPAHEAASERAKQHRRFARYSAVQTVLIWVMVGWGLSSAKGQWIGLAPFLQVLLVGAIGLGPVALVSYELFGRTPTGRPIQSPRRSAAIALTVMALMGLVLVAANHGTAHAATTRIVAYGLLSALGSGTWLGFALRRLQKMRPDAPHRAT